MKRIYLASDIAIRNNWNKLHRLPMRRRSHINVYADHRLSELRRQLNSEENTEIVDVDYIIILL